MSHQSLPRAVPPFLLAIVLLATVSAGSAAGGNPTPTAHMPPPIGSPAAAPAQGTPVSAIFLPLITQDNAYRPTATPTRQPACALPAVVDAGMSITVTPDDRSPLEQRVGRVPFTVTFHAQAGGGVAPYSFCWDIEPDGQRDAAGDRPTFTLTRPDVYTPLVVVTDANGHGLYVGTPPAAGGSR